MCGAIFLFFVIGVKVSRTKADVETWSFPIPRRHVPAQGGSRERGL